MKSLTLLALILTVTEVFAQPDFGLDDKLKGYAQSPQWLHLLHMKRTWGTFKSRIVKGSPFFLADDGFMNPEAELRATLATFRDPSLFSNRLKSHPFCVFPARWLLLNRDLGLGLPEVQCPEFATWLARAGADRIELVYAAQFLSNPASILGHTFLKLKAKNREDFLNPILNYAAQVPDEVSGLEFAVKGLLGGFQGDFSENLYYEKIQEYANMERRDLWEYTLRLSPEEKTIVLYHLWELLQQANFSYYFLSDNCSYVLLSALQPAFPGQDFLSGFYLYAAPLETIKRLDRFHLIEDETYRPSITSQLLAKYQNLDQGERHEFFKAFSQKAVGPSNSPRTLEAVLDKIGIERYENNGVIATDLKRLETQALVARSKMGVREKFSVNPPPSPLKGHAPHAIEAGGGYSSDELSFTKLVLRPAVHAFMDRDAGYAPNSIFEIARVELRLSDQKPNPRIAELTALDLGSFDPFTKADPSAAWRANLGYLEAREDGLSPIGYTHLEMNLGFSWALEKRWDLMALALVDWQWSSKFQRGQRLWPGAIFALVHRLGERGKLMQRIVPAMEVLSGRLNKVTSHTEVRLFSIGTRLDLGLSYKMDFLFMPNRQFEETAATLIHDF